MVSSSTEMGVGPGRAPRLRIPIIMNILGAAHRAFSGRAGTERRMELVETLQLGGRRQLLLIVCDGKKYLVGAGNDSVHSIAEMREPAVVTTSQSSIPGQGAHHLESLSSGLNTELRP